MRLEFVLVDRYVKIFDIFITVTSTQMSSTAQEDLIEKFKFEGETPR